MEDDPPEPEQDADDGSTPLADAAPEVSAEALEPRTDDQTPVAELQPVCLDGDEEPSGEHPFPNTSSFYRRRASGSGDDDRFDTLAHRAFSIEASYENRGEIARGNMGAIIRTRDRDLERDVALKVMLDPHSSPTARMRFLREAQITGQLEHPNIVPIHCLGTDTHGNPVFSMKLVRGITLDEVIEDTLRKKRKILRDWPLERMVATLIPVCHAIEFAHSKGVIHRDLKPSNIMLGDFGEVLVMDWGLARQGVYGNVETRHIKAPLHRMVAHRRERAKGLADRRHDSTGHGAIVGTPKYMSPEQARGETDTVDPRSDVYALGAILYDILALRPPVTGNDVDDILVRVAQGDIQPPQPPTDQREIPRELAAIAMKALALYPSDRYQSAEAFRADLLRWQGHRTVSAKEDSGWESFSKMIRRNPTAAAIAAIAMLALAMVVGIGMMSQAHEREQAMTTAQALREESHSYRQELRELAGLAVFAARSALGGRDPGTALSWAERACVLNPDLGDAHLMAARIHIINGHFAQAEESLHHVRRLAPEDKTVDHLLALCGKARFAVAGSHHRSFAEVFALQGDDTAAQVLTQQNRQRLTAARERLDAELPDATLAMDEDGAWRLHAPQLPDPMALGGLPLSAVICEEASRLVSTDIFRGMPLQQLILHNAIRLSDLRGLRGLPVQQLELYGADQLHDITPLATLPLERLIISEGSAITDIEAVRGLPLRELTLSHCPQIEDFSPLTELDLTVCGIHHNHALQDLSIFASMPLESLSLVGAMAVSDLSPLREIPTLESLDLTWCSGISDLRPIADLPLRELHLVQCRAAGDLRPIANLPLTVFSFSPDHIRHGLEGIRNMASLERIGTSGADLHPPAVFWQLLANPRLP